VLLSPLLLSDGTTSGVQRCSPVEGLVGRGGKLTGGSQFPATTTGRDDRRNVDWGNGWLSCVVTATVLDRDCET
jgi:hypothetical protein